MRRREARPDKRVSGLPLGRRAWTSPDQIAVTCASDPRAIAFAFSLRPTFGGFAEAVFFAADKRG
jgi:hypothetical protein